MSEILTMKKCVDCTHLIHHHSYFIECNKSKECINFDKYELDSKTVDINHEYPNPIKPTYYGTSDNDVIKFCLDNDLEFWVGNTLKYMVRAGKKNSQLEVQDLEKAKECLQRKIDHVKEKL